MLLTFKTTSVTYSRTPGNEENSCNTPSICSEVTAAPWSEDNNTRRSALPSVRPKPRSSGSATTVATRFASSPGSTESCLGLIRVCQFFCSTTTSIDKARIGSATKPGGQTGGGVRRRATEARDEAGQAAPQTWQRWGGRQPLCGIGVTSRIEVIAKPTAWSARNADSRPEPGPFTSMSRVRMPCSIAFLPASSAATCAAYGVDLREPL